MAEPTISISVDGEVYNALFEKATTFEDTPNSVLRRLLGLSPARVRGREGRTTPQSEFVIPVLQSLEDLGGRAATAHVIDRVGEKLKDSLTKSDRKPIKSGEERWRNQCPFVRRELILRGYMQNYSPRGVWEITERGREYLAAKTGLDLAFKTGTSS